MTSFFENIIEEIKEFPNTKRDRLDLSKRLITDEFVKALVDELNKHPTIIDLDLGQNPITLGAELANLQHVTRLNLTANRINKAGVEALVNSKILYVNLNDNGLNKEIIEFIQKALAELKQSGKAKVISYARNYCHANYFQRESQPLKNSPQEKSENNNLIQPVVTPTSTA